MTLDVCAMSAGYGSIEIIKVASFAVAAGECVAIVGPNGAGKSTLIKALAGLLPVTSGSIKLGNRDISAMPAFVRARAGIGTVPEELMLFPELNVKETLLLPVADASQRPKTFEHKWNIDRLFELFPPLSLRPNIQVGNLSGGEQRMVAICRALLLQPDFVLLDEPSAGLAPVVLQSIEEVLGPMMSEGLGVVLTEQNVWFADRVASRTLSISDGLVTPSIKASQTGATDKPNSSTGELGYE